MLYNMRRYYIATEYNMLYNITCYISTPLYNAPWYIAVLEVRSASDWKPVVLYNIPYAYATVIATHAIFNAI